MFHSNEAIICLNSKDVLWYSKITENILKFCILERHTRYHKLYFVFVLCNVIHIYKHKNALQVIKLFIKLGRNSAVIQSSDNKYNAPHSHTSTMKTMTRRPTSTAITIPKVIKLFLIAIHRAHTYTIYPQCLNFYTNV